jgi:hypothetical protein
MSLLSADTSNVILASEGHWSAFALNRAESNSRRKASIGPDCHIFARRCRVFFSLFGSLYAAFIASIREAALYFPAPALPDFSARTINARNTSVGLVLSVFNASRPYI